METSTQELYTSNKSYLSVALMDINDNSPKFLSDEVMYRTFRAPLHRNTTIAWVSRNYTIAYGSILEN